MRVIRDKGVYIRNGSVEWYECGVEFTLLVELNRYAELLYKRLTEEFYPARQSSFLA